MSSARLALGQPAIMQLLDKEFKLVGSGKGKDQKEKKKLTDKEKKDKVEAGEKACVKMCKNDAERITVDDLFVVLSKECKLSCTKMDLRKLVADLDMDKDFKLSIKVLH